MKSKAYATSRNAGMMAVVLAIGIAGATNIAQAQKTGANGINDASEQAAVLKRDPFWPVGYVPKNIKNVIPKENSQQHTATVENSWNEAMKKVLINGVSSQADNAYFAVINGEVKSIGDTVSINHGGTIYTWSVDEIQPPSSVKLRRVSAR